MKAEELARQYADNKVEERKEYPLLDMHRRKVLTSFDGYAIEQAFEDGFDKAVDMACKWIKDHLWHDAQGDDLPEYGVEVIAMQGRKIVFAHRPYKGKYIGKSLTTGNIETFENQTYDKGGWNIPDVKYWLDAPLPEGIE